MASGGRLPGSSLAPLFPLPLVGAAVLLAVLIVLTPNLLSTGSPSAGSVESQLEILIDRAPAGDNATHVYLRGLGLVRYQSMELAWAPLPGGSAPPNLTGILWTHRTTGGPTLELESSVSSPSFALNASATFVDAAGNGVRYHGAFALVWSDGVLYTTGYGDAVGSGPSRLDQLPLVLLPPEAPLGGGP